MQSAFWNPMWKLSGNCRDCHLNSFLWTYKDGLFYRVNKMKLDRRMLSTKTKDEEDRDKLRGGGKVHVWRFQY